jgi:hypothetical protein
VVLMRIAKCALFEINKFGQNCLKLCMKRKGIRTTQKIDFSLYKGEKRGCYIEKILSPTDIIK